MPRLQREVGRIVGDDVEAQDVVQDVMLRLWDLRERLDSLRSVDAFALVTARRHAINALRRYKPERYAAIADDLATDDSPEDILIERQMERQKSTAADAVMAQLPDNYQTLLRMRHIEGYDTATIAAMIGATEGAVRTALSRARRKVALIFKNQYQQ